MRSAWLHITFRKWQKILINFSSDLRFEPKKSEKNGIRIQIFECLKICIEFMKFSCDFFMLHVKTFFHFSLHSTAEGNLNFWARFYSSKKKMQISFKYFSIHNVTSIFTRNNNDYDICAYASEICSISISRKIFPLLKYLKMFISEHYTFANAL